MSELRELYQQVILDHHRQPRNFRILDDANRTADGFNPLCGDRVHITLRVEDGVVKDAAFKGTGCAISTASASMMTECLKGKTTGEAMQLFELFHDLLMGKIDPDAEVLGKLAVFHGVREFPVRVKCATLAWHTFKAALEQVEESVATE
jgi:nitrogen fixation protein NifU and related proteins